MLTLKDRLLRLAMLWADTNDRSVARLATIVANDGKLFERLEGGASCTLATFERFCDYLNDPANWPETGAPVEARGILDSVKMLPGDHTTDSEAA